MERHPDVVALANALQSADAAAAFREPRLSWARCTCCIEL
jgi:hypothetical protein